MKTLKISVTLLAAIVLFSGLNAGCPCARKKKETKAKVVSAEENENKKNLTDIRTPEEATLRIPDEDLGTNHFLSLYSLDNEKSMLNNLFVMDRQNDVRRWTYSSFVCDQYRTLTPIAKYDFSRNAITAGACVKFEEVGDATWDFMHDEYPTLSAVDKCMFLCGPIFSRSWTVCETIKGQIEEFSCCEEYNELPKWAEFRFIYELCNSTGWKFNDVMTERVRDFVTCNKDVYAPMELFHIVCAVLDCKVLSEDSGFKSIVKAFIENHYVALETTDKHKFVCALTMSKILHEDELFVDFVKEFIEDHYAELSVFEKSGILSAILYVDLLGDDEEFVALCVEFLDDYFAELHILEQCGFLCAALDCAALCKEEALVSAVTTFMEESYDHLGAIAKVNLLNALLNSGILEDNSDFVLKVKLFISNEYNELNDNLKREFLNNLAGTEFWEEDDVLQNSLPLLARNVFVVDLDAAPEEEIKAEEGGEEQE